MHELFASAADLILGARCPGCGCAALTVCRTCGEQIAPAPAVRWPHPIPPGLRRVQPVAAGSNAEVLRRVLIAWKEDGHTALTPVLGHLLAAAVVEHAPLRPVVLVPVPTSRRSRRQRGTDLVDELARTAERLVRKVGLDVGVAQSLTYARQTVDQAGLGAEERAANLAGAFRLRSTRGLADRDVIVVDDILTTGATVAETVRVLTAAGYRPSGVAVVAATPRNS